MIDKVKSIAVRLEAVCFIGGVSTRLLEQVESSPFEEYDIEYRSGGDFERIKGPG